MRKAFGALSSMTVVLCLVLTSLADVRIKQRVTMSGQTFESTRSIKGPRERTEQKMQMGDPSMADYMPQIATITQCDLKRRVQINDRKQLYLIDPFSEPTENEARPARPTPAPVNTVTRKGGTMTMSFNVRDTGERKMLFGLQARHFIWTQEMESSPDSCNGPHKTKIEFDGWYVDFAADFSCPTTSAPTTGLGRPDKPDCIDRIVSRGSGTPPKGIMIEGTMKMYGPDGSVQMTQTTETLELSRAPLDASLFDIPVGYKQAASSQELYAMSMPTYGGQDREPRNNEARGNRPSTRNVPPVSNLPAAKSVSVNITVMNSPVSEAEIEQYVRSRILERGLRTVSGSSDYSISVQFRQVKESAAGKIGGIFGKVTGVDTKLGKVDIDMTAILSGGATGEAKVKNKFEGPPSAAVRAAIDQALDQLLSKIGR